MAIFDPISMSGAVYVTSGCTVAVRPFSLGNWSFSGGTLSLLAGGTWFVGVDLFSKEVIALPRLGHRGWVPLAKVVTDASAVTSLVQITPQMPTSRLPRVTRKMLDGQPINVVVMGSSLAEGGATTDWSGMLFNAASSVTKYKLPGTINFTNVGLGGVPNQYQLAQLGFGSSYVAVDYASSGYPTTITGKTPPNGRSTLFTGVDLVILTTLANGGDYRIQSIEPILRNLRKLGVEVILTTDNAQDAAQVGGTGPYVWAGGYAALTAAPLYTDASELMRLADLYGVELADTAAYVADAVLRYPTANIYRDAIHMYAAAPNGRTGTPSGGYEVYARAIRSCIPVDYTTNRLTYDFSADVQGWTAFGSGVTLSVVNGKLNAALTADNSGVMSPALGTLAIGDEVEVWYDRTTSAGMWNRQIGVHDGSAWKSNVISSVPDGTAQDKALSVSAANSGGKVLIYNFGSCAGNAFALDNVTIEIRHASIAVAISDREYEGQKLPASRIVTDYKTPGDAFVILPKDEYHLAGLLANRGTLGASPLGAASFARRFSSAVGAAEDLLMLAAGQRAAISALGVVGFSLIYYAAEGDPEVAFDVYVNNTLQKTLTIPAPTITRETYLPIYSPTQWNKANATPSNDIIDIRVTSGTLRIAALLALTFELDLLAPEAASRIGTWTAKVPGGYPNMPGYGTDTAGDYAVVQCPLMSRRIAWILSSKPNSKPVDTWSGRTIGVDQGTTGSNQILVYGNHVGPGEFHYIKLKQAQTNTDQSTNGYGLHIGGLVAVNDR